MTYTVYASHEISDEVHDMGTFDDWREAEKRKEEVNYLPPDWFEQVVVIDNDKNFGRLKEESE